MPPFQRLVELRGAIFGYTEALAERLLTSPPSYETVGWETVLDDLGTRFGDVTEIMEESALGEVEENTRRLLADIRHEDTFVPRWAADSVMARLCYVICRLVKPRLVVETGVAYGVSAAFILTALEVNGRGALHSIDLPPLRRGYARSWGVAVPPTLKGRWTLHRGPSSRVLPGLLERLGGVDVFLHDSLHTYRNMRREFDAIWPHLRTGGILLADDIERNGAFGELRGRNPALWRVVQDLEKQPLHGNAAPIVVGMTVK